MLNKWDICLKSQRRNYRDKQLFTCSCVLLLCSLGSLLYICKSNQGYQDDDIEQTYGERKRATDVTRPVFQVYCQKVEGLEERGYRRNGTRARQPSSLSHIGHCLLFLLLRVIGLAPLVFELCILSKPRAYVSFSQRSRSEFLILSCGICASLVNDSTSQGRCGEDSGDRRWAGMAKMCMSVLPAKRWQSKGWKQVLALPPLRALASPQHSRPSFLRNMLLHFWVTCI